MLFIFIGFIILAVSFSIGSFAFPQIVGSLQRLGHFSLARTLLPIAFWSVILIVCILMAHSFLYDYIIFFYIGLVVALLFTLKAGFIQ